MSTLLLVCLGAIVGAAGGYWAKHPVSGSPPYRVAAGTALGLLAGWLLSLVVVEPPREFLPSALVAQAGSPADLERLLQTNDVAVVSFLSPSKPSCENVRSILHEIADEYAGKATVVEVDADKSREVAHAYGVGALPEVRFFQSGRLIHTLTGEKQEQEYYDALDDLL